MSRPEIVTFQGFSLDPQSGQLRGPKGLVALRPKAVSLLSMLLRHAGHALGKAEILDEVWAGVTVSEETLTQTVHEIRRALGDDTQTLVRTLPRRGYMVPAEALDAAEPLPEVAPDRSSNADPAAPLTVAVLPFSNLSNDPEQGFFADGLTDDLITALAMIRELQVVPRALSALYGGRDRAPVPVALALGARYLLEGSVRAAQSHIRVTTQLLSGADARQIWSRRFEGDAADIFRFQDQITREVCAALAVEFTLGDASLLAEGQTQDLMAWERMVTARSLYTRFSEAGNRRAQHLLTEALAIDPGFVAAMVQLGMTYFIEARFFSLRDRETVILEADALARRAIAAKPDFGSAWMLMGAVAHLRDRHDECLAHCRKACALAPGSGWVQGFRGAMCNFAGELTEALEAFGIARRLAAHPFAWVTYNHALTLMWAGDLPRARALAETYLAAEPGEPYAHINLATIAGFAGHREAARRAVAALLEQFPEFRLSNLRLSQRYRDPARLERVLKVLAEAGMAD